MSPSDLEKNRESWELKSQKMIDEMEAKNRMSLTLLIAQTVLFFAIVWAMGQ